ncbi:MAG TPA: tRNA-dihydrouridine synthase family protein [Phycisphaerales bacterium]|nr:tRNA-dihydrouridine synthase family protein [Phycisphaerales bacterium]
MSVETERNYSIKRVLGRSVPEIARSVRVDDRVRTLVPGFDAPFFQAGLAGYSDAAMRLVARKHGCPYCITEALLDRTLIRGGKGRRKEDPEVLRREALQLATPHHNAQQRSTSRHNTPHTEASRCELSQSDALLHNEFEPGEELGDPEENRIASADELIDHPIAGQIMGSDPSEMAQAAEILVEMGYDVVDVNLACPVKKMRKANRGGHCLTDVEQSVKILKEVRKAVPAEIPCTVKLRRAFDDTAEMAERFERIFCEAYDCGYAWATVHCRTVVQKYLGPGRWEFLTDLVRRHPDKVIFGSGDVWGVDDIFAMLELTGVHAVSVARGCIGNPWIFRQARELMRGESPTLPSIEEQREVLLEHFRLSVALHGEKKASKMMRKFGIKFAIHHPQGADVKLEFIRCSTIDQWKSVVAQWYGGKDAVPASNSLSIAR